MIIRGIQVLPGFLLSVLLTLPTLAISVRTVNLEEMVAFSGRVFYGTCISAEDVDDPASGLPLRLYRFRVLEAMKGVRPGEVIEVRQVRSSGAPFSIPGVPQYRKGSEALLFLYPESRLGLTSPVGLDQGLFRPERLENGELGFRNGVGNRNLAQDISAESAKRLGLSEAQLDLMQGPASIPLSSFVEMIAQIERNSDRIVERIQ